MCVLICDFLLLCKVAPPSGRPLPLPPFTPPNLPYAPRERELHLPAAADAGDRLGRHLVAEARLQERCLDVGAALARLLDLGVGGDVLDDAQVRERRLDVVLDVQRLELVGRREAVELPARDRAHERRLARAVRAAEPVAAAAQQAEARVVQQDLAAVREREAAVAELLVLVVVALVLPAERLDGALLAHLGHALCHERAARGLGRGLVHEGRRQVGHDALAPLLEREVARVHERAAEHGDVVERRRVDV